jgi:hypothetical protein
MRVKSEEKQRENLGKYREFPLKGKSREFSRISLLGKVKNIEIFPKEILREKLGKNREFPSEGKCYIYYVYIIRFLSLTVKGESSRATAYARRLLPLTLTKEKIIKIESEKNDRYKTKYKL